MHLKYTENSSIIEPQLLNRRDPNALRIVQLLGYPDLTRKNQSPVRYIVDAVMKSSSLAGSDIVEIPEILSVSTNFDLLNTPDNHPSRSPGDSYYVDESTVLRTQTTSFWPYYLRDRSIVDRLNATGEVKAVCYGKVYRKDEIDRSHFPVFHQIDGLCITNKDSRIITLAELESVARNIAESMYGQGILCRIVEDTFPFTNPSIQLEIQWHDKYLELMGAGLVHTNVLSNLGLDPAIYNGWAFGFGLDRLAMVKMNIPDIRILWMTDNRIVSQFTGLDVTYREVSRFPATNRDVSIIISRDIPVTQMYELIRECGHTAEEDLIEEVKAIDQYEHEKFGSDNVGYTVRIVYRSNIRTLTTEEINFIQEGLRNRLVTELKAILR